MKKSKGFIYLVEIAVAGILITIVLSSFFGLQKIKASWDKSDLVSAGNNIFYSLKSSGSISKLLSEPGIFDEIKKLKPKNIEYGIKVSGTPPNTIHVACTDYCDYAKSILTPAFVNNRKIIFDIKEINIATNSLTDYDVLLVINNSRLFTTQKDKIKNFLKNGTVISINDTLNNNDADFNEIFGLTPSSGSSFIINFTKYDPIENKIPKYFLGFGFDIETPYEWSYSKKYGYWNLWENKIMVNITETLVEIYPSIHVKEGETFSINGPDGKSYKFKVKKIFFPNGVELYPLDTGFVFKDFSENNVKGNTIVGHTDFSAMTKKDNAIWISGFVDSDEYRTLVKAAASLKDKWYLKEPFRKKESIEVSFFIPQCCDMPESPEFNFILWYSY